MKIKIGDIKPNPFRQLKSYPISEAKLKMLETSIKETGFWDNILARKNSKGQIEIAYGHHRLKAVKKVLGNSAIIDIPVKKLDNTMMIRIMANENDKEFDTSPAIICETIKVVKEYLEKHPELKKKLPDRSGEYKNHSQEVRDISAFLGGNWNPEKVGTAVVSLKLIEDKRIDKKAHDLMPTQKAAKQLTRAIKSIDVKVPALVQRKIAQDTANGNIPALAVREKIVKEMKDRKLIARNEQPSIESFVTNDLRRSISNLIKKVHIVNKNRKHIDDSDIKPIKKLIDELMEELSKLTKPSKGVKYANK